MIDTLTWQIILEGVLIVFIENCLHIKAIIVLNNIQWNL